MICLFLCLVALHLAFSFLFFLHQHFPCYFANHNNCHKICEYNLVPLKKCLFFPSVYVTYGYINLCFGWNKEGKEDIKFRYPNYHSKIPQMISVCTLKLKYKHLACGSHTLVTILECQQKLANFPNT